MASLPYSVIIDRAPDGRFHARIPALPEADAYGASVEMAFTAAGAAIESALAARKKRGETIPAARFHFVYGGLICVTMPGPGSLPPSDS